MVRLKSYKIGDIVRLKSSYHFPLPGNLRDGVEVKVVAFDIGRRIVEDREGIRWDLAMQNIDTGFDYLVNGEWVPNPPKVRV